MDYKELRLQRLAKKEAELLEQIEGKDEMKVNSDLDPAESGELPEDNTNILREEPTTQKSVGDQEKLSELDTWKNRALTAEGRFNKAKPKYDENIFKLRQTVSEMQQEILSLKKELAKADGPGDEFEKIDNKHTRNVLGDEVVESITDTLRETRESAKKEADQLRASAAQDAAKASYNSFYGAVTDKVKGDMEAINNDPAFHNFLDTNRSAAGTTYRQMFDAASRAKDADDVSDFFNTFLEIKAKEPQPVQDSVQNRRAPSNSQGNTNETHDVKPIITMDTVEQFKTDMARGAYKGRYTEMQAMQASIEQAYTDGTLQ